MFRLTQSSAKVGLALPRYIMLVVVYSKTSSIQIQGAAIKEWMIQENLKTGNTLKGATDTTGSYFHTLIYFI